MSSCGNGNCGCGSSCKCDRCTCGQFAYSEKTTIISGVAPMKLQQVHEEATEMVAGEGGHGCKCGPNCKCDPCNC